MRKTKIVATLGPASDDPEIMRALIANGLDVARFNFSHGDYESHKKRIDTFRNVCKEANATVACLDDTKGPEIRLETFEGDSAQLVQGNQFVLTTESVVGTEKRASVTYSGLTAEVSPGARILLDDGMIELVVKSVTGNNITTEIMNSGKISNRKSVNVPGISLKIPYISPKDRADIKFFVENEFDIIAASFVRSASDIKEIRDELYRLDNNNKIKIIAKIENSEGVENVESILSVCDGLMVARGDLGVELEYEELPIIQKDLIKRSVALGKPVITATHMLESMIHNPRPTRAEASDVANAIYDGTSAIMLSGETANGKYPAEALAAMAKIAERIERAIDYRSYLFRRRGEGVSELSTTNAISHATVTTSHDLNAPALLTVSLSGNTAYNVSKFRPICPIIACTPSPITQRQLKLAWGVLPLLTGEESDTTALFNHAVDAAREAGYINEGELVVLTAGVPVGHSGTTNLIKVHVVGEKIFV